MFGDTMTNPNNDGLVLILDIMALRDAIEKKGRAWESQRHAIGDRLRKLRTTYTGPDEDYAFFNAVEVGAKLNKEWRYALPYLYHLPKTMSRARIEAAVERAYA
jgi:hypothetical protein